MTKSKVLVTGATGLLGPYIIKELIAKGYDNISVLIRSGQLNSYLQPYEKHLRVVHGDLLDLEPLNDTLATIDLVVHAAALVSFDPAVRDEMYKINVDGTANIVNLSLAHGIKKLVHVSSIAALGRPERAVKITEETKWVESKYNSYYGVTKYRSELEVWRGYTEGLPVAIVNPSLIYGRGDYSSSSLRTVKYTKNGISMYPPGSVGMVDVRDVAKLIVLLLSSDISGERYVASSATISYKDLFTKLATYLHVAPPQKAAKRWMADLLWRAEFLRSKITGKAPVVTKETVQSSFHRSDYDVSKSLALEGFSYRDPEETLRWTAEGLLESENHK